MLITGNYLYKYFLNKCGLPYSGSTAIVAPVWNKYLEEALITGIDERMEKEQNQKWKDEMSGFIATNVLVQGIGNNSLNLSPIVITKLVNNGGNNWTAQTNIPFSPQSTLGKIDIQGAMGSTGTYPNGQFTIISFTPLTVKGVTAVNFTAAGFTGTTNNYYTNSGMFSLQSTTNLIANQLIDYIHLLNVKCKYTKPLYNISCVSSNGGTPETITLNYQNNLRSSSLWNNVQVTMSGWRTNTDANGTFYIKVINDLQFELYSDINLQNPVVGSGGVETTMQYTVNDTGVSRTFQSQFHIGDVITNTTTGAILGTVSFLSATEVVFSNATRYIVFPGNVLTNGVQSVTLSSAMTASFNSYSITLALTYYNSASKYLSTQKANTLDVPTWEKPGFELAGYKLNFYPMNIVNNVITTPCSEVTIDYVCKPKLPYVYAPQNDTYSGLYIDGNDNVFDLSTIASEKFWLNMNDRAANALPGSTRDLLLAQISQAQLQNNP